MGLAGVLTATVLFLSLRLTEQTAFNANFPSPKLLSHEASETLCVAVAVQKLQADVPLAEKVVVVGLSPVFDISDSGNLTVVQRETVSIYEARSQKLEFRHVLPASIGTHLLVSANPDSKFYKPQCAAAEIDGSIVLLTRIWNMISLITVSSTQELEIVGNETIYESSWLTNIKHDVEPVLVFKETTRSFSLYFVSQFDTYLILTELPLGASCDSRNCLNIDEGARNDVFGLDHTYGSSTFDRSGLNLRIESFEVFLDVNSQDLQALVVLTNGVCYDTRKNKHAMQLSYVNSPPRRPAFVQNGDESQVAVIRRNFVGVQRFALHNLQSSLVVAGFASRLDGLPFGTQIDNGMPLSVSENAEFLYVDETVVEFSFAENGITFESQTLHLNQPYVFLVGLWFGRIADHRRLSAKIAANASTAAPNVWKIGTQSADLVPFDTPYQTTTLIDVGPFLTSSTKQYLQAFIFVPKESARHKIEVVPAVDRVGVNLFYLSYFKLEDYLPLVSTNQETLCCFSSDLERIKAVTTTFGPRYITQSRDGSMQVWKPSAIVDESVALESVLRAGDSESSGSSSENTQTNPDFVVFETNGVGHQVVTFTRQGSPDLHMFDVMNANPPAIYEFYILVFNFSILVSLCLLAAFICYFKPEESSEHREVRWQTRSKKLLTLFGLRVTMRHFTVHKLKGYVIVPFHRLVSIPKKVLALAVYLVFVLAVFSPNVNPGLYTATNRCVHVEEKLEAIGTEALLDLNHKDAMMQYHQNLESQRELNSRILNIRTISNGVLFAAWPNGTQDSCEAALAAAYAEAKAKLTSECDAHVACEDVFLGVKGSVWDALAFFFERSFDAFKRRFARIEEKCIPERGTKVPCPVDTSVITDLIAAQDLLTKYQTVPKQLPQKVERVEESIMREIEYLLFLIALGNDVFIGITILSLFVSVPISLYRSSLALRLKRLFFTTTQLKFVVVVLVAVWTLPYIFVTLSIAKIQLFLHNHYADSCYAQPSFLASVASKIVATCSEMDNLQERFYTVQYQLRENNVTANEYKDCSGDAAYASLQIYGKLDLATQRANQTFVGLICDQKIMSELRKKYSLAPGEPQSDFTQMIFALGFLCQAFGAMIFARFGLSFANAYDPLLLSGAQVEAEAGAQLPATKTVERFLFFQRFPSFAVDSVLVFLYSVSTLNILFIHGEAASAGTARIGLLITAICASILACCYCCQRSK